MNVLTKIACRTLGVAGMGIACYDAAKISKQYSKIGSDHAQEHYLEDAYFNSRTSSKVSYVSKAINEKTFDIKTKNPIPSTWGKIKGRFQGFMYGLGNYLPEIGFSVLAIAGKNFLAKLGAIGLGCLAVGKVLHEGFGVGKNNPIS